MKRSPNRAVGCNFEDSVGGRGFTCSTFVPPDRAARAAAETPFINARTPFSKVKSMTKGVTIRPRAREAFADAGAMAFSCPSWGLKGSRGGLAVPLRSNATLSGRADGAEGRVQGSPDQQRTVPPRR